MPHSAFDHYAEAYDRDFTHTPIGQLQRRQVYRQVEALLDHRSEVLELNCGTGEDALWLASRVKTVLATDVSSGMIEVLRAKGLPGNLKAEVMDARNAGALSKKQFDLVFSNFGGLNCLSPAELQQLSKDLSALIKPGGKFVAVIMTRSCLWHKWLKKQKPDSGDKRASGGPVSLAIGGSKLDTYYYDPHQFVSLFGPHFKKRKVRAIGLFVPPSYMNAAFVRRPRQLWWLARADRLFTSIPALASYADHFLVEFQKV